MDLSDYQAFGRTGLESMACGCAPVVPLHGGADEYAIDGVNALVVDTHSEDACFERIDALLRAPERLESMRQAALRTASRYSIHAAAVSELVMLSAGLARHRLHAVGIHRIYGNDGSSEWCTFSNPSKFFSHRRDRVSGRLAASVWLG